MQSENKVVTHAQLLNDFLNGMRLALSFVKEADPQLSAVQVVGQDSGRKMF